MPILNRIHRRSFPRRCLLACFYVLLTFGAVWMVYPFLLMISGSMESGADAHKMNLIPRFLFDESALYRKFMEQRYGRIDLALAATRARDPNGHRLYSFETFPLPSQPPAQMWEDWKHFQEQELSQWPYFYGGMGHVHAVRSVSEVGFMYQNRLREAFPKRPPNELNVILSPEDWTNRNFSPPQPPTAEVYWALRKDLPPRYFYPLSLEGIYGLHGVGQHYGFGNDALDQLNQEWQTRYASLLDAELKPVLPQNPAEQEIWSDFVRNYLSARYTVFSPELLPRYREFLKGKYGRIEKLNETYKSSYGEWGDVEFSGAAASDGELHDATTFLRTLDDLSKISLQSPDFQWRDFLREKYGDAIQSLNAAWKTEYTGFGQVQMPIAWQDLQVLRENKAAIILEFATRNYRFAWNQIVISGNSLRNTVVFCLLNILVALIVNPLAAYALSRFRPRWGHVGLFVLMATMAFPAEVTQIPSFLLLRELGWLNTFAALVIPAAANGYSIFLLKGFFDSLPADLYEAASIDGCGDLRAFFAITVPLSAPILAVVALAAFTAAYGAFMFALLVCQKESMWTMMVYIYQLQQSYHPPVVFAALVIAAIPTLTVFVFCQNIIMRGIVVPVEK